MSLHDLVDDVIAAYPQAVEDYKNGDNKALGFMAGIVMREMPDATMYEVTKLLKESLK